MTESEGPGEGPPAANESNDQTFQLMKTKGPSALIMGQIGNVTPARMKK